MQGAVLLSDDEIAGRPADHAAPQDRPGRSPVGTYRARALCRVASESYSAANRGPERARGPPSHAFVRVDRALLGDNTRPVLGHGAR